MEPLLESQLQRRDDEDTLHPSYVIPHILQRTPNLKGPLTANWTSVMNCHLNTQVRSGIPVNDEALWDHVYNSFRRQYADMQERERAEDTLQRGISMRPGELDAYIAEYEVLVEMAGYDPNS